MNENQIQEKAQQIVGFKQHVLTYTVIVPLFFILDLWDNGRVDWAFFPTLGWGIGLLAHCMNTYGFGMLSVDREAERLRKKYSKE